MFKTQILRVLPLILFGLLTGCVTVPQPYDYSALREEAPRSILVIAPVNNSIEVDASYTYLSTISEPLAEKGYYVFPVSVIDTFLKSNGLPTPAEMNGIGLDKIRQHIGADAVLYVTLNEWGQKFNVFSSHTVVKGQVKLVSTKTGNTLWQAPLYGVDNDNNNVNHGLLGALISAVATQIIGSISDNTPRVARQANHNALNARERGLLPGPYYMRKNVKN